MCYDLFLDKTKLYFAVLLAMKTYNKAAVFYCVSKNRK